MPTIETVAELQQHLEQYAGDAPLALLTDTDPPIKYEIRSVVSRAEIFISGVFPADDESVEDDAVFITIGLAPNK
jgi:hypothetical protein